MLDIRNPRDGQLLLFRCEVRCCGGRGGVWEEEIPIRSHRQGDQAVNLYRSGSVFCSLKRGSDTYDEQPPPTGKTSQAVHGPEDTTLDDPAEHATSKARRGEDSRSLSQLFFRVPRAQNVMGPCKHAGLGVALEEPDCHRVLGASDGCGTHSESSPDGHHGWKENSGFEL